MSNPYGQQRDCGRGTSESQYSYYGADGQRFSDYPEPNKPIVPLSPPGPKKPKSKSKRREFQADAQPAPREWQSPDDTNYSPVAYKTYQSQRSTTSPPYESSLGSHTAQTSYDQQGQTSHAITNETYGNPHLRGSNYQGVPRGSTGDQQSAAENHNHTRCSDDEYHGATNATKDAQGVYTGDAESARSPWDQSTQGEWD